jgi:uncharacterized protein (DUF885 family)
MPVRVLTMLMIVFFAALPAAPATPETAEGKRLHQLFEKEWDWGLQDSPETATYVGDPRYNDRWSDHSPGAFERRRSHARELLAEIRAIDRSKLSADDQLNYDLFLRDAGLAAAGNRFPAELNVLHQMGGVHQDPADFILLQPRDGARDYEKVLARLRAIPALVDQDIALMRRGLAAGITPPRLTLRNVAEAIAAQVVDDPAASPLYGVAFAEMPREIPAAEQERLRTEAKKILREQVIPAYRRLHQFFTADYYPKTRESIALSAVPEGRAWYEHQIRVMTTTDLTADQIHEIGLSEVKRIRAEMERVKEKAGFRGSLQEFFHFLRTDPQFFFTDEDELLVAYRDISKRIDPGLTKLFGVLPRLPYGVVKVPEYSEKTQTTAYYQPGSPEAGRAGFFYANTYDLKSRPKWEMEALTVHEAVPGHHLQIALAQELENVPDFRRHGGYTAYVEGWGLYSESLGDELGLYADPYSKFGQLTYEMWRAIRLVVDTGMHSKGWSRDQAIEFFKNNSSKAEHDIAVEVDRYIVWPAQALAYKLGELKIKELRNWASQELGERFDVRKFHDTVLGAGPLPLSILESRIKEWVRSEKKRSA